MWWCFISCVTTLVHCGVFSIHAHTPTFQQCDSDQMWSLAGVVWNRANILFLILLCVSADDAHEASSVCRLDLWSEPPGPRDHQRTCPCHGRGRKRTSYLYSCHQPVDTSLTRSLYLSLCHMHYYHITDTVLLCHLCFHHVIDTVCFCHQYCHRVTDTVPLCHHHVTDATRLCHQYWHHISDTVIVAPIPSSHHWHSPHICPYITNTVIVSLTWSSCVTNTVIVSLA